MLGKEIAKKAIQISKNVYWVGAIDRDICDFHGYQTARGTTYNAYLILGDEPVLIDTVKKPFYDEMMARIKSIIEPENISYIISNHAEMDHSGSLPLAIEAIHPDKIYASKMGSKALRAHFNWDLQIETIDLAKELELGVNKFKFIETRMLHWPDSMFSFYENDGILFSQDGFGMHMAVDELLATDNDKEIMYQEAAKYFANILMPYADLVAKLLENFASFNLDVKIIAPDHGPIYTTVEDIEWIMKLWGEWATQKTYNKVVIAYDTMWQSTDKMAQAIASGVVEKGVEVKIMPLAKSHRSDVAFELLEAGALVVGSPTINKQIFPTVADLICYLKGLARKNLIGQAFGSYGWAAEGIKILTKELDELNIKSVLEPIKCNYVPDDMVLVECREFGNKLAEKLMEKNNER